jgi:hypothetical protein
VAELAYAADLKSVALWACGFESHLSYQSQEITMERVIAEALDNIDRITDLTNDEKAKIIADELKRVLANQLIEQLSYL